MTDKPTDEALENLFVEETGFDVDDFPAAIFDFARAVLAKWGQPAQAAEPVARLEIESLKAQLHAAKQINAAQFGLLAASIPGSALRASHVQAPAGAGEAAEHYRNAIARARLLDSDLSNLTERGAAAWAGVDAQKLREDGTT